MAEEPRAVSEGVSWHETSRDEHRGKTYVGYRCSWCGKKAVVCVVYGETKPGPCCCSPQPRAKR